VRGVTSKRNQNRLSWGYALSSLSDYSINLHLIGRPRVSVSQTIGKGFFIFFLWCSHHPQEELAKFGYMSERKVKENIRILAILWRLDGKTYCSKYVDFRKKKFLKLNLVPFSPQKSLVWVTLNFLFKKISTNWRDLKFLNFKNC